MSVNGAKFNTLSEDDRMNFENIEVSVCIFIHLSEDLRKDYFRRIQNGVPLSKTEIVWSMAHPFMTLVRQIRVEMFEKVKHLWETNRYTDLHLFFNIANVLQGGYPRLHSDNLIKWLNKQDPAKSYDDLAVGVRTVITILYTTIKTPLHQRMKSSFTLDIVYWTVSHGLRAPPVSAVETFSATVGRKLMDQEVTDEHAEKYYNLVKTGAMSTAYTRQICISRAQIISEVL
jgi:hypothetical protein